MNRHVSPHVGGSIITNARGAPQMIPVPRERVLQPALRPRPTWKPPAILAHPLIERLPDPIPPEIRVRSAKPLIKLVSEVFDIPVDAITGPRRTAACVRARHTAMWLARRFAGRSYPEIARAFGGRDHTTALYGCRRVDNSLKAICPPAEDTPEAWADQLHRHHSAGTE